MEKLDLIDPQETLLRLAWDFWNGTGESDFGYLINILSVDDFDAFKDAISAYGKLREKIRDTHLSGSQHD